MTERSRAADAHEQATNDLLKKLRSKDDDIKVNRVHRRIVFDVKSPIVNNKNTLNSVLLRSV